MADRTLAEVLRACARWISAHMGENSDRDEHTPRWVVLDPADLSQPQRVHFQPPTGNQVRPCTDPTGHDHVLGPVSLVYDVTADAGWDGTLGHKFVIENKTMTVMGERDGAAGTWTFDRDDYHLFVIAVPK